MNRYQKLICQMAKDDRRKPYYKLNGISFRIIRNSYRTGYQGVDLRKLIDYKNWNKENEI